MGDRSRVYTVLVLNQATQANSAFHPSGVGKWITGLVGWGEGGAPSPVGWQVTLCDPIWQVTSHSSEICSLRAIGTFNL